jgi:hypothetical protein
MERTGHTRQWLQIGLLVAAMWAVLAPASQAATAEEFKRLSGTTWYTVSFLDQRAGWACSEATVEEGADGPRLRVIERMEAQIRLAGAKDTLKLSSEVVSVYDKDLRPVESRMRNDEFGRVREVVGTLEGGKLSVVSRAAGDETRQTLDLTPQYGSEMEPTLQILRGQLKVGDRFEMDVFNPELGALDHHVVDVIERTAVDGRPVWKLKSVASLVPVETETLVADDGTTVESTTTSLLKLTLKQATEQEALAAAAPLVLGSRISANKRIEDFRGLSMLKLRMVNAGKSVDGLVTPCDRQTVQHDGDALAVTIRRIPFEGQTVKLPVQDPAFAEYLQPSELAQTTDPEIVKRARAIIGTETDARLAAEKIVRWVYDNMEKVSSEPRLVSAREILDDLSGDCTEHAILCGTLCAAVGIPARMVTGIAYARGAFYYHAWNELYVGKWVEMDGAWGETSVGAGHVRMASGPLNTVALANLALQVARTLGTLDVEIQDFSVRGGGWQAIPEN